MTVTAAAPSLDPLALALQTLRKSSSLRERKRKALGASVHAELGITTHRDCGAFHADQPAGGVASETPCEPFLAFTLGSTHGEPAVADARPRLRNTFPFFGDGGSKPENRRVHRRRHPGSPRYCASAAGRRSR